MNFKLINYSQTEELTQKRRHTKILNFNIFFTSSFYTILKFSELHNNMNNNNILIFYKKFFFFYFYPNKLI